MYDQEAAKFVVNPRVDLVDRYLAIRHDSVFAPLEASRRENLVAGSTASYRLSRLFAP